MLVYLPLKHVQHFFCLIRYCPFFTVFKSSFVALKNSSFRMSVSLGNASLLVSRYRFWFLSYWFQMYNISSFIMCILIYIAWTLGTLIWYKFVICLLCSIDWTVSDQKLNWYLRIWQLMMLNYWVAWSFFVQNLFRFIVVSAINQNASYQLLFDLIHLTQCHKVYDLLLS